MSYPSRPLEDRFWEKVSIPRDVIMGCWLWTAFRNAAGYGLFRRTSKSNGSAHRTAYELVVGEIPEGLHLDHLCRNPGCVNPSHLEPVTCRENLLRGLTSSAANAAKTHCPNGHPLSGDNLYRDARGSRSCRTCVLARSKAYDRAHREKRLAQARARWRRKVVEARGTP